MVHKYYIKMNYCIHHWKKSRIVNTTKVWELFIQGKDNSPTWNKLKDVKDLYPFQMDEFAAENRISEEPAFVWWVKYVLNKQERIISKTQRFWVKTHKYGIRVPNTVKEAIEIDKDSGDTLWWDTIMKEMKNSTTCVRSLGETQGRSTNWIPRNQVSHDIRHKAW